MGEKKEIPSGWTECNYGDLLDYMQPTKYIVDSTDYDDQHPTAVLTAGKSFIKGYTNERHGVFEDLPTIIFDDFTTASRYVNFPFKVKSSAMKILVPSSKLVCLKFVYYSMQSNQIRSDTHKRYWISVYAKKRLFLPPLNEQKRIVNKIEELFSEMEKGIESLETAREQLEAYRQSLLKHAFEGKLTEQWREDNRNKLTSSSELLKLVEQHRNARYQRQLTRWNRKVDEWEKAGKLGPKPRKPPAYKSPRDISEREQKLLPNIPSSWQFVRLSEVAQIGSGMSVSASRELSDPIEVPYLRVANVQRGFLDLAEIKYMRIEKSQLPHLALRKWDVLFNEGGDRDKLGRGWIWESQIDPCITQNHVFRASPILDTEQNALLISHWGNSFGKGYFEKTGKQSVNLASINKTVLSEFPVPLISPEEQQELCNQLDLALTDINSQENEISTALARARLLRQAILKKAYGGELVEQDPNDEPASILLERILDEKKKTIRKKGKEAA